MAKSLIIVAPHEDDEIIGCFELINKSHGEVKVLYPNANGTNIWSCGDSNPLHLTKIIGSDCELYLQISDFEIPDLNARFLFPDPIYETHPEHRKYGAIGEALLRRGIEVVFYSVNMQAPYIRETQEPYYKKNMLDHYYGHKSKLWEYDHKYFLFEGQCMWWRGSKK